MRQQSVLLALVLCLAVGSSFQPSDPRWLLHSRIGAPLHHPCQYCDRQSTGDREAATRQSVSPGRDDESIEGRRILTMVGYRFSAVVYLLLGLFLIGCQARTGPIQLPLACHTAAGPLLAGGVSYVLEGAAVNDRLSSETFKRLNLFLVQYGALWLLAAYLVRHNPGANFVTHPLVLAASMNITFNSWRAWIVGVRGWQRDQTTSLFSDFTTTVTNYLQVMFSIKSFPGSIYLCGALLVCSLKIARLIDVYHLVTSGGVGVTVFSEEICRISMYSLLSAVLVTLKDGGDGDRLTGSSYVELNTIATLILGVMGAYFYNLGSIVLGAGSAFMAFFTGTMGYLTYREKRQTLL